MSRKLTKPEVTAVIKWTEEEWGAITDRLLEVHGLPLLSSAALEEIKAKDVFNAQDVLAPNRHRKLISISQGFSASRQRLHALIQLRKREFNKVQAGVKAKGKQQSEQVAPATVDSGRRRTSETAPEAPQHLSGKGASPRSKRRTDAADKADLLPGEQLPTVVSTAVTEPSCFDRPTPSSGAELPGVEKYDEVLHQGMRKAKGPDSSAQATAGVQTDTSDASGGGDVRRKEASSPGYQQRQLSYRNDPVPLHVANTQAAPAAAQPSVDLVELARPFVAMVCQEFASALVSALSRNGGGQNLPGALQAVLSGTPVRQSASSDAEASAPRHVMPKSHRQEDMPADDDTVHWGEADVQPLFDPKLPPSANSAFNPKIGLIGASSRDFDDLQQFYPQLHLTVVIPDAVRNAPGLGDCQRMLGLREDISAETDEYLRRAFGNRYLRLTGGAERIREQLNAWLDNPGSINSLSRPRKQFKGKGGGMSKKRHNRQPGAAR